MNEVYYRIIFSKNNDAFVVVTMQDFDERDYDQSRFINERRYDTEHAAERALNILNMVCGLLRITPEQMLSTLNTLRMEEVI